MPNFTCSLCFTIRKFPSFVKLFYHIGRFHRNDVSFRITCNLSPSCGSSYRSYAGYKAHLYRNHRDMMQATRTSSIQYPPDSQGDFVQLKPHDNDLTIEEDVYGDEDEFVFDHSTYNIGEPPCEISVIEIQRFYLRFLLQLREEHLLPKKIISIISSNIIMLLESLEKLIMHRSSLSSSTQIDQIQDGKFVIEAPVVSIVISEVNSMIETTTRSEYQFINLSKRLLNYEEPKEILLSSPDETVEYGYMIPVERTLSSLFHREEIFSLVNRNVTNQRKIVKEDSDLMFSLREGNFGDRIDDKSVLVQIYIDDIGLTNPIGPRSNLHKMTMVYLSVEDLPDEYRSEVQSIYLLAVAPSNGIKKSKNAERFFGTIVNNLNALFSDGLMINGIQLKFTFSTLVADNLAAHQIGGYRTSFSSGNFCRRCHVSFDNHRLPSSVSTIQWRTALDHDRCLNQIQSDPLQRPVLGITGPSVLETLIGFHPTTALPADCMHDFFEGSCPHVIMLLLKEASAARLITYARIQKRIEDFDFGILDSRDRPPPILIKHLNNDRVPGSAAQKLLFFRLFPIIFPDIIELLPSACVYLILREILQMVLSYPFRKSWIPHLHDLCNDLQQAMIAHFPSKITPKIHFITEYSKIIEDYGPCRRYWCMRYEGRHAYFKQVAIRSNNYKNVAQSLATRYQLKQCIISTKSKLYNSEQRVVGVKKLKEFQITDRAKDIFKGYFGLYYIENKIFECKLLWSNHVEYHQSCIYVVGLDEIDERPYFAQVIRIVHAQKGWLLLMDRLKTVSYSDLLCAWKIETNEDLFLIEPQQLKYYHKGLDIYHVNGFSYVSLISKLTDWVTNTSKD